MLNISEKFRKGCFFENVENDGHKMEFLLIFQVLPAWNKGSRGDMQMNVRFANTRM